MLDPHTSVAKYVVDNHVNNDCKVLIAGTAHFGKFPDTILKALNMRHSKDLRECFESLDNLPSNPRISDNLKKVLTKPILHKDVIEADKKLIKAAILDKLINKKI